VAFASYLLTDAVRFGLSFGPCVASCHNRDADGRLFGREIYDDSDGRLPAHVDIAKHVMLM
jgi:hypothetical protein